MLFQRLLPLEQEANSGGNSENCEKLFPFGKEHQTCTLTYRQAFAMDLVSPASVVAKGFDAAIQVNEE